jgi:hypothetical protein
MKAYFVAVSDCVVFYFSQKPFTLFSSSKSYYFQDFSLRVSIMSKIQRKIGEKFIQRRLIVPRYKIQHTWRAYPPPPAFSKWPLVQHCDIRPRPRDVMFLMRADPLGGPVGGGWALEIESFLGPVKWHWAGYASAIWGPKNLRLPGPTPPTCPKNESARIKNNYVQGHINHRLSGPVPAIFPLDHEDF